MLKIGIIDSGINQCAIKSNTICKSFINGTDSNIDKNGHGTMCAHIIEKYSGCKIQFYSYKIFDKELISTERVIVSALMQAIDDGIDILNLSLSIHLNKSSQLDKAFELLKKNKTKVIAARSKENCETYLDNKDNVEVVYGRELLNDRYYKLRNNKVICDSSPIVAKWNADDYDFFGGNSKATALYTASYLRNRSCNYDFKVMNACDNKRRVDENIKRNVIKIIYEYTGIDPMDITKVKDWEKFGDIFTYRLLLILKDYLGNTILDTYTIYYNDLINIDTFANILTLRERLLCI